MSESDTYFVPDHLAGSFDAWAKANPDPGDAANAAAFLAVDVLRSGAARVADTDPEWAAALLAMSAGVGAVNEGMPWEERRMMELRR